MKATMKRPLVVLFVWALVGAACTSQDTTTTTAAATTTTAAATTTAAPTTTEAPTTTAAPEAAVVVIGTTFPVTSMDPADSQDLFGFELIRNVGESLLKFVPGSAEIVPGIAEAMPEISDDGTTYTLRLRDGIMFGDGLELTAPMYVESLQRGTALEAPAASSYIDPFVESVEATDDRTIVFHLSGAYGFFPSVLTLPIYVPAHPDIFPAGELNQLPDAPIYGVGPWTITDFVANEQVVLEPNPNYYGEQPSLEQVIVRQFADSQTMALALENGEIDVAWRTLDAEQVGQLEEADGITVSEIDGGRLLYYIVNHQLPPFDDPNVIKAVAYAIDRDELVDRVYGGSVNPLFSQIPEGILGAKESFDTLYASPDLDAARELLTGAGYSETNPAHIVLGYPGNRYGDLSVDAQSVVKEQLEATGMIEVELQSAEAGAYFDNLFGGEAYNLGFLAFEFDFPDPDNHVSLFVVDSGLGTFVTDPENNPLIPEAQQLLDLLNQGATTTDPAERGPIYEELQDIWAEAVVTLPLWRAAGVIAYRDGISGDPAFDHPESLNVGATNVLEYATLHVGG